jgi:small-conductance mechanosensitive channel
MAKVGGLRGTGLGKSIHSHVLLNVARLFLATLVLAALPLRAQQSGSNPPSAKTPANPLASLLKEKPKSQVVDPELPPAIPEVQGAIPLPDVAARSLSLSQKMRDSAAKLPTRDQIDELQASVTEMEPDLQTKLQAVNVMLSGTPNSLEVREEENFWRGIDAFTTGWQQQLLTWANNAQDTLKMLDNEEPAWRATLEENKENKELEPVLTVIKGNLAEIHQLRKQAQDGLQLAVNLQIRVSNLDAAAKDAIARLAAARTKLKGHLLDRDSLPLWRVGARREQGESPSAFRSVSSRWISIAAFLKQKQGTIAFLVVLFAVSLIVARRMHELTRNRQASDETEADAYRVLRHWIALALMPPMMVGYVLAPSAPVTLLGLVIMVSFFPILIILPPLLTPRFRALLYVFSGMYALSWATSWIGFNPVTRREVEFFLSLTLLVILGYLVWPSRRRIEPLRSWNYWLQFGIRCTVLAWGVSLIANVLGYLKLAHYLAVVCIYSTFVAICVFTAWRVLTLLLKVGLRAPESERLAVVRLHRRGIERWMPRVLKILGLFVWLKGTFDLLGLSDGINSASGQVLGFHLAGSPGGATLGGVVGFFVILTVGYAISASTRFLFREEILRRFHLARGLPELIASIIYYLLMVMVVLAAVNAGGIELNKFTVLTGAFGVGIGFGLQNIINNFVSGLILQFERPIHIDDILEVDNNMGKVTRIGVRSSTIQTFQGAEVILPNATLISSKVINWTLSESRRRRELPVGVAYGSDPKLVLEILSDAAAKHELVLTRPEPMAYFKGFGESSLDFELHFWVMQENNGMLITSEVALAIMRSLNEAGIEIPFPQRDLHVRSVDPNAAESLQSGVDAKLLAND